VLIGHGLAPATVLDYRERPRAKTGRSWRSTPPWHHDTRAGEAMANVLATSAQFERRLVGQRTREALAQKKAQGYGSGGRPPCQRSTVGSSVGAQQRNPVEDRV
jgi:DNA invertase Pin-like site-specific DNA recombinase